MQLKKIWGGLNRFFSKGEPLQANLELAFFLPQGLFFSLSFRTKNMAAAKQKSKAENNSEPLSRPVSDEAILKVAKEVVVKFIEVGQLSPTKFDETFQGIYKTVHDAVRS